MLAFHTKTNEMLSGLSNGDREALGFIIKAAKCIDEIFYYQVLETNPILRDWLQKQAEGANASGLDKLKWSYYKINKSPWSSLDENEPFLTTKDSAVKLVPEATKAVRGWKGLEYKVGFPSKKPPGANFYPSDMDKKEFELWKSILSESQQEEANGFFTVIRRKSESGQLYIVPYSKEYESSLKKAAEQLHKAADLATTPSLKNLLHAKADAFLSNDYYESDIAWMDLDSKLDITIGPYETYEDSLFGYKATFESFIGVRDDEGTARIKMFGDNMLRLEQNLPMDDQYKSTEVKVSPIRVIQLIYNSGDVDGPQINAFNLPNDERIVKDRGTSMVIIKNIQEAKFEKILKPIANVCISNNQKNLIDFDSFFTHITCHECIHGIGPHTITLPDGSTSTVRQELQELHTVLEEAKADILGLWALRFFISQGLLPKSMLESMYVSFLATCLRAVRFGLQEAHGRGQALQFNWLFGKEAIVLNSNDDTFSVDFTKVEEAVESLSREILTIQAKGDKQAATALLQKYGQMTPPLQLGLDKLEKIQVSVDIAPSFPMADEILIHTAE
ncbi:Nudix hydrolase 3 [Linum grandiflorum]